MNLQEILSTPQTGFVGTYTQPMSGTDVVNGAFQEEAVKDYRQQQAEQAQQNLLDAARAEAVRQDPTLNYVQRQLAQGLLGAKRAYAMAEANGNDAGMAAASKAAQGFRDQASSIGWNPSDYGSDVPLEVAMQNMANNDTRAVNNLLYGGMTPDDYYQQQYNDMVRFGVDKDLAAEEAQRKTEAYHRGRASNMLDSFYSYGVDDRGAITPNGVRILSMMASEDGTSPSEIASYISKMQPTPQQNWNFENSMILSDKGMQQALQKIALQNQYRQQEQDVARQRAREDYAWKANFNDARAQQAMQQRAAVGEALGLSGDGLQSYILTGKLPSSGKGGKSGSGEEKPEKISDKVRGVYQNISDLTERAQKSIRSGEVSDAGNSDVNDLYEAIESAISAGQIKGDDVTKARNLEYGIQFEFNKKTGNEDEAAKAASYITPEYWAEHYEPIFGKQPD